MILKYKKTGLDWPISIEQFRESLSEFITDYEFVRGSREEKKLFAREMQNFNKKSSDEELLLAD